MNFEAHGKRLQLGDATVEFDVDVSEVVEIEDLVVVQLEIPTETEHLDSELCRRNVRCVEPDGSIRWTIERAEPSQGEYHPYTGLWREEDSVWAYNWNGVAYELDLDDGSQRDSKLMK